jgi:hypothetical protein
MNVEIIYNIHLLSVPLLNYCNYSHSYVKAKAFSVLQNSECTTSLHFQFVIDKSVIE